MGEKPSTFFLAFYSKQYQSFEEMHKKQFSKEEQNKPKLPWLDLLSADLLALDKELRKQRDDLEDLDELHQLLAHLMDAGGKRLRPVVVLLGSKALEISKEKAINIACAAEWIHSASLFHDDVVDRAETRRNLTASHLIWGNTFAVLGGDYCLSMALDRIQKTDDMRAFSSINKTVRAMIVSELVQLKQKTNPSLSIETYYRIIKGKTASLMSWCSSCAEIGDPTLTRCLSAFGYQLGLAFQITDDVLDMSGDETLLGKSVGQDLKEGNFTLPVILASRQNPKIEKLIRQYKETAEHETETTPGKPDHNLKPTEQISQMVKETDALKRAMEMAKEHARKAESKLTSLPHTPWRSQLLKMADFAVNRKR